MSRPTVPGEPRPRASLESVGIEGELRRMIITGDLAPGSIVTQAYLGERLGCGRMPLRDAIQRLAATNTVVHVPNRGIYVPQLDVVQLNAAVEALELIHGKASRLAAERITLEESQAMADIIARLERLASDPQSPEVGMTGYEFHRLVGQASHNEFLADAIVKANEVLMRTWYVYRRRRDAYEVVLREHRAIFQAIVSHDPDAAEARSVEHFRNSRAGILDVI